MFGFLGLGRTASEAFIQKEAANLIDAFRSADGELLDNHVPFAATGCFKGFVVALCTVIISRSFWYVVVSNVVSYMLFGDSFDSADQRFIRYIEQEAENFRDASSGSALELFPWLRFVPPYRNTYEQMRLRIVNMMERLQELIDDHKKHFDPNNPGDYIDAFLVQQKAGIPSFTGNMSMFFMFFSINTL